MNTFWMTFLSHQNCKFQATMSAHGRNFIALVQPITQWNFSKPKKTIIIPGRVEVELNFLDEQSWWNLKMADKIVLEEAGTLIRKKKFLLHEMTQRNAMST